MSERSALGESRLADPGVLSPYGHATMRRWVSVYPAQLWELEELTPQMREAAIAAARIPLLAYPPWSDCHNWTFGDLDEEDL
jgi:hypothetical protein